MVGGFDGVDVGKRMCLRARGGGDASLPQGDASLPSPQRRRSRRQRALSAEPVCDINTRLRHRRVTRARLIRACSAGGSLGCPYPAHEAHSPLPADLECVLLLPCDDAVLEPPYLQHEHDTPPCVAPWEWELVPADLESATVDDDIDGFGWQQGVDWLDSDHIYASVLHAAEVLSAQLGSPQRVSLSAVDTLAYAESHDCPICMEPLTSATHGHPVILGCGASVHPNPDAWHCFHAECISTYFASSGTSRCPSCRDGCPDDARLLAGRHQAGVAAAAYDRAAAAEQIERDRWAAMPPAARSTYIEEPTAYFAPAPVAGEWSAVDQLTILECLISPCGHVEDVPEDLRVDWARAHGGVFQYMEDAIAASDALALERALKWHFILHDVLLRGPRRGTTGGGRAAVHHLLGLRFQLWRDGQRETLITELLADRRRCSDQQARRRHRHDPERDRQQRIARVLDLVRDGELSRAMRLLHSLGIADVTPGILRQLARKHPERAHSVPLQLPPLPGMQRVTITSMGETFRGLRRRAGTGLSGARNEYLRALVGDFADAQADRVIERYDTFATRVVNVELPVWWYSAASVAQLMPLVKRALTDPEQVAGVEPDVRPVAVGEVEIRAIERALNGTSVEAARAVLTPQQLAVGVPNGTSILVHGIRLHMELHPDHVVVKLDLANGFNAVSRVDMIRRMTRHPTLVHLVPFLHACLAAPTELMVGHLFQRLFPGLDRGGSSEGTQQGRALSSMAFCVAIHPELVALDEELRPFGGFARAFMDDGYAAGPPSEVFAAVQRFGAGCAKGPLHEQSPKAFRELLELNVVSLLSVSSAVLRHAMLAQGRGHIINISSRAGKMGLPGMGPYVASKFAVEGLTATLAAELDDKGILVNSISPGMVDTRSFPKAPGRPGVRSAESIRDGLLFVLESTVSGHYLHVDEYDAAVAAGKPHSALKKIDEPVFSV